DGRDQVRGVLGGAAGDRRGQEQVGAGIDDRGQLRPVPLAAAAAGPADEVVADRAGVVAGRIDRCPGRRGGAGGGGGGGAGGGGVFFWGGEGAFGRGGGGGAFCGLARRRGAARAPGGG